MSCEERTWREQRQSESKYRGGTRTRGGWTDVRREATNTVAKQRQARYHGLQSEGKTETTDRVDPRWQRGKGFFENLHQRRSREGGHLLYQIISERSRTGRFGSLQVQH